MEADFSPVMLLGTLDAAPRAAEGGRVMKVNSMAGFYSRELLEMHELGRDLYRDELGEDPEIEKVKQKVKQIEENRKEKNNEHF